MKIAEDEEVLTLSSYAQSRSTSPKFIIRCRTLFITSGKEHHKTYYSSLVENTNTNLDQAFDHFKNFLKSTEKKSYFIPTKLVQTNEVRRCAYALQVSITYLTK
ncbi:DUF2332 family protein [Bacillus cereus]